MDLNSVDATAEKRMREKYSPCPPLYAVVRQFRSMFSLTDSPSHMPQVFSGLFLNNSNQTPLYPVHPTYTVSYKHAPFSVKL